jgi:3-hydroxyacyl-CoA dehydrogenase
MCYADTVGLKTVLARIEEFRARHGEDLWSPAPLLVQLAESGGTFASWDRAKESGAGLLARPAREA